MVTKPTIGQDDWGQTLNNALDELQDDIDTHGVASDPHGAKAYADANFSTNAVVTVSDWLATAPVLVAHRGSGAEFPEQTMAAFDSVVAAGAKAIEVSVHLTADGVPVCFHDTTLDRMTGASGPIADRTYAELRETVSVEPQGLLGDGWANQRIPTMREVLDRFLGRVVIFLDAKSNDAIPIVQDMVEAFYPSANRSVVWKNYYASNSFPWAKNRNFTTWGYWFTADGIVDADLDGVDANVDIWGPELTETDSRLGEIIARGKPVIAHVAHRHGEVARLTTLGATGAMCATVVYNQNAPELTSDRFASQTSAPGVIPFATYDPDYALKYDGAGGAYTERLSGEAICMGGNKAPADDGYTLAYSLKWDTLPATTSQHADLYFGKTSDDRVKYFATDNASAGYSAFHRANGDLQLYKHTSGSSTSTQLGTVSTEAPVAGTPMDFEVEVTATQVILRRTDTATPYELVVTNAEHRGRYWHIGNGSVSDQVAVWSNITVS